VHPDVGPLPHYVIPRNLARLDNVTYGRNVQSEFLSSDSKGRARKSNLVKRQADPNRETVADYPGSQSNKLGQARLGRPPLQPVFA